MCVCVFACVHMCVHVCVSVCMYVCVCVSVCLSVSQETGCKRLVAIWPMFIFFSGLS